MMQDPELEELSYSTDYDINVRIIAFAVVTIVLIVVMIFFLKTYATQKQQVLKTLTSESQLLDTFCKDTFNQNLYIMHLLSGRIKHSPEDLEYIYNTFQYYKGNGEIQNLLGWQEIILLNKDMTPIVSSTRGILSNVPAIKEQYIQKSKKRPGISFYGTYSSGTEKGSHLMYTIMGLQDAKGKYLGSLLINYDMSVLHRKLSDHKKNSFTNFVLLDRNRKVILQSKPIITGVGIENGQIVNKHTAELIRDISAKKDSTKKDGVAKGDDGISYLDMVNGVNYFIKKINNGAFVLLVNIDHEEIKTTIFHSVIMKFLEISIFASFFLLLIVSIYRREAWLRSKAEAASQIALRATTAKSDFLAFTAHEIRSPLGFIMTGSEIMQNDLLGPLPPAYKKYVDGIHKNSSLILEFITDILDEEHILSGNFKIVNGIYNITDIINDAINNTRARYNSRAVTIVNETASILPQLICDGKRILQVLNNLLSNAIKYSKNNTTVTLKAYIANELLVIEVQDQGIGMTDDEIKIAFTKYGTVRTEHFNFIESYGLGLPIVKLLLNAHEASLDVSSKVNVGTTMSITFPKHKLIYNTPLDNEEDDT